MQSLPSMLDSQIAHLENLAILLDKELHLISSRNAEELMALLTEKERALDSIQSIDSEIKHHYHAQLSAEERPDDVQERLDKAQKSLEQCQYLTQINQKAVEQGQLRLTHLRNLMLEVRAKESLTYDKKGKPSGGKLGSGISA
ncbi:flagellar export chaperone FlgN [Salinimonas chungwhensis]|uniref:flagellar export chaperone FlgN n=1 Tax=Salinimonas chungwhensis TaxID=265425 RepID=UPI00037655CD|nr:flagellar export chaperone FlgN [Salinimonas chungwhensis]